MYNIVGRVGTHEGQNVHDLSKSKTLWREELTSWYIKTWWYAKARIQSAATTSNSAQYFSTPNIFYGDPLFEDQQTADKWSWCARTLLEDASYTNINIFGLAVSLGLMVLIYLTSYCEIWRRLMRYIKRRGSLGVDFVLLVLNAVIKFSLIVFDRGLVWCYRTTRSVRDNGAPSTSVQLENIANRYEASDTNLGPEPRNMEFFDEDETIRGSFDEYDFPLPMSNASQAWVPW
ncbi:hypothetical protein TWF694_007689 [Orbilia ellipsospora]|uniref:Uncharacterized protein n=1 Tax=Orbilia ellipsospora TaxID=2528407 RepID=A0AAV9XIJ7_9PEZI